MMAETLFIKNKYNDRKVRELLMTDLVVVK